MKLSDIIIDDEFSSYLPALSDDERDQLLKNMTLADARGEKFAPLYVWKGHKILLDGHHRHDIADSLEMELPIEQVELPDRAACLAWIRDKQLGQRNLSKEQRKLFLGEKYNATKQSHGGQKPGSSQNENSKTADKLAKEHHVSAATVTRAGKFADEVAAKGPEERKRILSGKPVDPPKKETPKPKPPADDFLKRAGTRFKQTTEEVSSLGRVLKELSQEDVGSYVNTARLSAALKEIRAVLKDALPVAKCGKCGGKGCMLCKDLGYVTQAHLEN